PRPHPLVALAPPRVRVGALALEAHPQIAGEPEWQGARRDPRERVAVSLGLVLPARAGPRVVGRGLAVHQELDVAVHASDRAQQDVFGLVIAGGPLVVDR